MDHLLENFTLVSTRPSRKNLENAKKRKEIYEKLVIYYQEIHKGS